ncbi:cation channel sperm-associated protein 3 isoform X1 [Tachyglossus aculeatus]|uniref:cation channel sperm-associated protein 3 isoform X1 n=1 Tax=Tachyglossus aculeatus TaxID=9261 RepID=UPI0018F78A71|nr:cation channel sperm-associated protein 3 isoform X1 [Tachyglossus aculeatus]XP_038595888.1 cation channel sperm-associated protein 3 isoform X1 [Tachyglossus aculeatus]
MSEYNLFISKENIKDISSYTSQSASNLNNFISKIKNYKRTDTEFVAYLENIIKSPLFSLIMIVTVSVNAFFMVLETDYTIRFNLFLFFEFSEAIFMAIYFTEFILKIYVAPLNYWKNECNLLDFFVLFIACIPYGLTKMKYGYLYANIATGIQSLRILKLICYSRGMMALLKALWRTVNTVASILALLFLLMFTFAILGHSLFGGQEKGDVENWGNLASSFFTLFSLATVDGWTFLQKELDVRKFSVSRIFTISFILLAFFVFLSMFIGVMIIHTEDSSKRYERQLKVERHTALLEEKQLILMKQQEEIGNLMQGQKNCENKSFSELVENFKMTLSHSDPIILDEFCATLPFIDIYLTSLDNQDNTLKRLLKLYYEIVHVSNLMMEEELENKSLSS